MSAAGDTWDKGDSGPKVGLAGKGWPGPRCSGQRAVGLEAVPGGGHEGAADRQELAADSSVPSDFTYKAEIQT